MAGTRVFLLVLLIGTLTCIVVIQVSLDGGIHDAAFQYSLQMEKEEVDLMIRESETCNGSRTHVVQSTITISERSSPKRVPSPPTEALPTSTTTTEPTAAPSPSTPPQPKPKSTAPKVKSRVHVRPVQVAVRPRPLKLRHNRSIPINPSARLQEILRYRETIQGRGRADPLRLLNPVPTVNPKNVTYIMLITYFRSGSTFVGDLLQQNWKTFYHFEPLHYMTYDRRIPDGKVPEAFRLFRNLYTCNFTNAENYVGWAKKPLNQFLFSRNLFLWFTCRSNPRVCFLPEFVSAVCRRAPVQIMKVTRMHMRQLRGFLLGNPDLPIKVVYLVRDPRGIISSRQTMDWCSDTVCSDPNILCNEMSDDIEVFKELEAKDPTRFIRVHYEELSLNPGKETNRLFKFLQLPVSQSVQRFLKTHTTARKVDDLDPYSTRRNSSSMAFSWQRRLNFSQVLDVQESCSEVIRAINYSLITSATELEQTTPKPSVERIAPPSSIHSVHGAILNPDRGAILNPDRGAILNPDSGAILNPDRGAILNPDRGAILNPDSGAILNPDRGAILNPDSGAILNSGRGAILNPDSGAILNPDSDRGRIPSPSSGVERSVSHSNHAPLPRKIITASSRDQEMSRDELRGIASSNQQRRNNFLDSRQQFRVGGSGFGELRQSAKGYDSELVRRRDVDYPRKKAGQDSYRLQNR